MENISLKVKILSAFFVLFLSGCASSPYNYYVKPTPIEKGVTKYKLEDVHVDLSLGHGAKDGDTTFSSQEVLTQQFADALKNELAKQKLAAVDSSNDVASISVDIDYTRRFNLGGKALNKPEVSHFVVVKENGERLAGFGVSKYTTTYGYLGDAAVNLEIASFNWGAEDELRDVELISRKIIEDLAELGE